MPKKIMNENFPASINPKQKTTIMPIIGIRIFLPVLGMISSSKVCPSLNVLCRQYSKKQGKSQVYRIFWN